MTTETTNTDATVDAAPAQDKPAAAVAKPTRRGWTCCCAMLPAPGSFIAATRSTNGRIAVARICNVRDSTDGIVFDVIGSYDIITPDPSWLWYELPELPRVSGVLS
jgi:hypothetical protein